MKKCNDVFGHSRALILATALLFAVVLVPQPETAAHDAMSTHDAVANIRERIARSGALDQVNALTVEEILPMATDEERDALGTRHVRFEVNVPVHVYLFVDQRFGDALAHDVFWLDDQGFVKTDMHAARGSERFDVYTRDYAVGPVGLGVNSLSGDNRHYFVALAPVNADDVVAISGLYPGYLKVGTLDVGVNVFTSHDMGPVTAVPEALKGATLVRVDSGRHRDARLTNVYTETPYPATTIPDQITLTWSDNPQTTQTVQWRTNVDVTTGVVAYMEATENDLFDVAGAAIVEAVTRELYTPRVINDDRIHRHTAMLTGLTPGTRYVYGVGADAESISVASGVFTTAPATAQPFTFVYMGDPQNGFEQWGKLVRQAERDRPEAAFCLIAGDLVNRGADRDDWDDFFHNASGYFARRTLTPVLGNHEYQLFDGTLLYNDIFTLLTNGPNTIPPQHAYSFEYSNALFVVLDSNQGPADQTAWLDKTLAGSDATWKFVSFHHPIYSSSPRRDNPIHRKEWMPLFEKHQVDMVLQGHDHAYLRTWPMKDNKPVNSTDEGVIYVVSVSGTKMYDLGAFDYAATAFADTATYQAIDIEIDGNRLVYRAYDINENCVDEVIIEK